MLHIKAHTRKLTPIALAMASLAGFLTPQAALAQVFLSVRIGPPALPVYEQPPCPALGYLWTPGFWAYGPAGYYWVPGVWVAPPRVGFLWTPGYWGFADGIYLWHGGYWGPHVGFYGGVNYGFGYGGFGFWGGGWAGGVFRYNTAVVNVNREVVRDTYVDRTVINNTVVTRASFNGPGGVMAQPRPEERAWEHEEHYQPTANQASHVQAAGQDRSQYAAFNHGQPGVTSMDTVNGCHFAPDARLAEQQHRIGEGIERGQRTPREGANLERRDRNIHQQVHEDRQANDGRLTQQERRQVNREQNRASRKIHEDRHPQ
jgi:hypothetical protein